MDKVDHKGHRLRLKNLYATEGLDAFNDYQVLELLLYYAIPYKDTNEIAHELLGKFGSLAGVFNADHIELSGIDGIGPHAAMLLNMIPALSRKYIGDRWKDRKQIINSTNAGQYAISLFIGMEHEAFYMICLDSQGHVIMPVEISEGVVNEAMVYPRKVIEKALRHNAVMVILAHNHPGGSTEPSGADIEMTNKLIKALGVISVKVMDHIIVAGEKYSSLAERGVIKL